MYIGISHPKTFSAQSVLSGTIPRVSGSPVMWTWQFTNPGVMTNPLPSSVSRALTEPDISLS